MNDQPPDITDLRPDVAEAITDKKINLAQLADALGTDQVWDDLGGRRVLAAVSQATLDAAVAAHVVDSYYGEPGEERDLGALREKALAVRAETDTFTAAQMQKLIAALVLRATRRT